MAGEETLTDCAIYLHDLADAMQQGFAINPDRLREIATTLRDLRTTD